MYKVLISDKMSPRAKDILAERGIEVHEHTGLDAAGLKAIIGDYHGLAIRSSSKVTPEILDAATNLKVIGRAGIGVDNVDVPAATARGVVVMNTPYGNSVTTAEHAIAMMFALARQLPIANASTHAGKWEKSRFMGVEVTGKTLGIIGCGNIGSIVAERALGLRMKVVAFDPFLTHERAVEMGVEKAELDTVLARADFITLHTPLNDKTRNILNADSLKKTRKGIYIINCARGGLIDEAALKDAVDSGHIAGAALDVFLEEPAKAHPLFGNDRVVATPHLGASTHEAQENVALQVAEQMADFLLTGAVQHAVNMPSVSGEDAARLKPFLQLAGLLGSFAGQLTESGLKAVAIDYCGDVTDLNTKPLTAQLLVGLLEPLLDAVNPVNALVLAKERGIAVSETRHSRKGNYHNSITLTVTTEQRTRSVTGTVFAPDIPRIVAVEGIPIDATPGSRMLFVRNQDKPGFIGSIGQVLGNAGINIATFNLGRTAPGENAILLVEVDEDIPPSVAAQIAALPNVVQVKTLRFQMKS
jgi:D-3-phosphoglycerate dehydrogenase / 2-oxoglutarate reductase